MPSLDQASIADLSTRFSGVLLRPDESGYDDVRKIHNGMIDRSPGVILRAASADDVAAGIGFARSHDVPLAIRGGGHSAPGLGSTSAQPPGTAPTGLRRRTKAATRTGGTKPQSTPGAKEVRAGNTAPGCP